MNILQEIFSDHYEEMIYILHPRKSVIENVEETIPTLDFKDKSLRRALSKQHHHFLLSNSDWRNRICTSFGYDPLQCPCCKKTMELVEIYHNHHRVPLEEFYRKAWINTDPVFHLPLLLQTFLVCGMMVKNGEQLIHEQEIYRGTQKTLYAKSTGRNDRRRYQVHER